jgi:diacylglycerol kinase family enzyme
VTGSVLIVNPYASRVTEELVAEVEKVLHPVRTLRTERAGHATDLAREADADAVVVFSGDGGFNEVLNGVRPDTVVGFLPGGGTSVLPRALGLPRDPLAAARRIALGRTRRISLGRANGRRFAFSAGIGLDAELIRLMDARGRDEDGRRPGDLVFAWTALAALTRHRGRFEPVLEISGHGPAAFALVGNCDPYTYAGRIPLRLTPQATFEGGLDVVAPREVKARTWPRFAAYALRGRGQERARDVLYAHDLDRVEIRCREPRPLQVDGEDLGDVSDVVLEAERDAVSVLV